MRHNVYNTTKVRGKRVLNFFITLKSIVLLVALLCFTSFARAKSYLNTFYKIGTTSVNGKTNQPEKITEAFTPIPIRGKVTDPKGAPLPGVSVIEKGTRNGSVTDVNGIYRLNVASNQSVLTFRFVGFGSQDLEVGNKTVINVSLIEANAQLNEVVVVAYGTQKKASVTGAISSVQGTELAQAPVANITNSIAGRVSGCNCETNRRWPAR